MSTLTQPTPAVLTGFDPNYLAAFEDKTFIEGPQTTRRLVNFFVLLLLATVIATYGILSQSTATVIGAMIVAPLMGPIIATTAAVVMGSTRRALKALALVVSGVAAVILLSYVLAWVVPDVSISFTSNSEITSRINPGIYALLTALGAGAAGAFIVSRAEISDSFGGVAIAISLVPPLCVVGIALQQSHWPAAGGAMLLFLTNCLAIFLAGGVVLQVVGLGRVVVTKEQARVRRRGFVLFVLGIVLIAIPLTLSAYRSVIRSLEIQQVKTVVEEWVDGADYKLVEVNEYDQTFGITIEGNDDIQPAQSLANQLARTIGRPVVVDLRILPALLKISSSP